MLRYSLRDSGDQVLRYDWFATQPPDPVGKGWRWVEDPEPAPPPAPVAVPQEITNFQMRAVLRREGHFAAIDALVQGSENAELIDAFEYANHVYRTGLAVASIKAAMGWSDEYLDQLFIAAAEIEA